MTSSLPPLLPKPYVAQQPSTVIPFINREAELRFLSEWSADRTSGSILTIVGIGGMGKTSLAWQWFSQASAEIDFDGRMWWSFYEADAKSFLVACYQYLSGLTVVDADDSPARLVDGIVRRLQGRRFLLVLDGFERQLVEYSPPSHVDAVAPMTSHRTRRAASFDIAEFIRSAATVLSGSKIIVTSRLALADLEDAQGNPAFGTRVVQLGGFDQASTRDFLSRLSVDEHADELVEIAARSAYHPLLISLLARQVVSDPSSLARLRTELNTTKAADLPQTRMMTLRGAIVRLEPTARAVAHEVAAFREPVRYSVLATRLTGKGKPFARESELDRDLSRLQNLGLLAWDQRDNTYSMHPVVRAVILDSANSIVKRGETL